MELKYINRIIDKEIEEKLNTTGAVLIRGPKWCGKTTSASQFAKSTIELQDSDLQDRYLMLANEKPSLLLEGEKPLLIDEWQIAPKLWNAVRHYVDKANSVNQFILTGSSVPVEDSTMHSGVGRFSFVDMLPMSLYESGDSNGLISLEKIYNGFRDIDGIKCDTTYESMAYLVCRGGWPSAINVDEKRALNVAKAYIDALVISDISSIDGVSRNPSLARFILKSYARQISTVSSYKALIDDVIENYSYTSDKTILDYINVLKKLYIVDEIEAWSPNIRSKTAIRMSNKKAFVDPSLVAAALEVGPNDLMFDPETFGLIFENLVNRDLKIYLSGINGELKHYRDRYGLECDNIVNFHNGKFALIETKLSVKYIDEAVEHLQELESLIIKNTPKLGKPLFKMIITGTDMAFTTKEGIMIVPIGTLKN